MQHVAFSVFEAIPGAKSYDISSSSATIWKCILNLSSNLMEVQQHTPQ